MDRLDTLTALGSSFSERLLHPRCVKERPSLPARLMDIYWGQSPTRQSPFTCCYLATTTRLYSSTSCIPLVYP
ncbi:hypothetical protein L3Q82_010824 [Scortum barcoo]|uniref:Uncharacterized protein n=1 Tax=Scortum barcoo TaxID=214431 RepID=A0ACB8W9G1_9TELE|nr:hypothetical protein L3Q82_010824 [Scortum barcoo]